MLNRPLKTIMMLAGRDRENKGTCIINCNVLIIPHSYWRAIVSTRFSAMTPTIAAVVLDLRKLVKVCKEFDSDFDRNCIGICF